MEKVPKLTFKRGKRQTGLSGVGNPNPDTDIKCGGEKIGYIAAPNWQSKEHVWQVRLSVRKNLQEMEKEPNCYWKWITMKVTHESEALARAWVEKHWQTITTTIHIHPLV